jgi:ankyrin repeat protein
MSALIEAAKAGDAAKVREALQPRWWRKPNPDAADKWGCTALHYAAENGCREIVEALLAAGADVNAANRFAHSPLHNAAREGRAEIVQLLLRHGADTRGHEQQDGSPLNWAIREKRVEVVKLLLAAGADTRSVNKEGQSALQVAEIYGTPQIAELIRQHAGRPA